jgi:hypothetical protein
MINELEEHSVHCFGPQASFLQFHLPVRFNIPYRRKYINNTLQMKFSATKFGSNLNRDYCNIL